jgi:hypothetical protein
VAEVEQREKRTVKVAEFQDRDSFLAYCRGERDRLASLFRRTEWISIWLMGWLSVCRFCRDHPIRVGLLVVLLLLIVILNDR